MDVLFPYLIHLVVLCISISLIFSVYNRRSSNTKLPPGKTGWPIIGETWDFVMAGRSGRLEKFTNDRVSRYSSEAFRTSLMGHKMAVFCGASGNKFLLVSGLQNVTSWFPRSSIKLYTSQEHFDTYNIVEEIAVSRKFLPEFLKPEPIKHHIPIMDSMAREHLTADWHPHEQVKVLPMTKKYAFAIASRLFLKIKDPDQVTRLENLFSFVAKGLVSLPLNFPGTTYNRAMKAGKMLREELLAIMKQRKRELMLENKEAAEEAVDLLTRMLLASDGTGKATAGPYEHIPSFIIGLLIASHDTTSSAITTTMYYLAENPDVYSKVLEEQMEIAKSKAPGELLNWDDVQKMKYSWRVACEAMRLSPPVFGGFKEAATDFSYAGFTIPKGMKLHWNIFSAHKNPKYFLDPDKFDPSRFEGNGPAPCTYVPFGAGPHMCPGKEYARSQILVFMHNVVTRFKWVKVIPDEKIIYTSFSVPAKGLPLHLQPH